MPEAELAPDHRFPTIQELRNRIRGGTLRPIDLVETCIERIREGDGAVHAFVEVCADDARVRAAAIRQEDRRPLAGIPVAVKANRDVAGVVTDHGSQALAGYRPTHDDPTVTRLRDAGAIIVGTTVCSEFSLLPSCEPATHPAVRNPRFPGRGPGGSSGGAAAAVAAGLVPLAHANDAAGSLRIPAASCGVIGVAAFSGSRNQRTAVGIAEGCIGRTLDDALLGATVLVPTLASLDDRPGRVAVARRSPTGTAADADAEGRVEAAAHALARAGWEVVDEEPPWSGELTDHLFAALAPPARARVLAALEPVGADPATAELEPYTREFLEHASRVRPEDHARALALLAEWTGRMAAWAAEVDVLLTPMSMAPPVGAITGANGMRANAEEMGRLTAFGWPANALRWPTVAIAGAQLMGNPVTVGRLISAARALESPGATAREAGR